MTGKSSKFLNHLRLQIPRILLPMNRILLPTNQIPWSKLLVQMASNLLVRMTSKLLFQTASIFCFKWCGQNSYLK